MRIAEFKELYSNFQGRKRGAVFQQRGLRMDQTMEFGKFLRCIVVHLSKTNSELFNFFFKKYICILYIDVAYIPIYIYIHIICEIVKYIFAKKRFNVI